MYSYLNCTVGDVVKHIKPAGHEGGVFEVNDGYMTFMLYISEPSEEEVQGFQNCKIEFGFCFLFGVFMCGMKLGSLGWQDGLYIQQQYSYFHRIINKPSLDYNPNSFEDGMGCKMVVLLVDSATKKVLGKRFVDIKPETVLYIKSCMNDQGTLSEILVKEYTPTFQFFKELGQLYSNFTLDIIQEHLKYIHSTN